MKYVHKDNSKKLLFLDIDGVLNSRSFFDHSLQYKFDKLFKGRQKARQYSLKALNLLKEIHDKTNCTIVMSSSWRGFYFSKDHRKYCRNLKKDLLKRGIIISYRTSNNYNREEYLKQHGVDFIKENDSYTSKTENIKKKDIIDVFYERGYQIYEFIRNWKEKDISFAILDDDSGDLILFNNDGYERFIQTFWHGKIGGLQSHHVEKIVSILNTTSPRNTDWMEKLFL